MLRITDFDKMQKNGVFSYKINEDLDAAGQTFLNEAIINGGPIELDNGEFIDPKEIVKVVKKAIDDIAFNYRTYYSFVRNMNIIFVKECPDMNTMCVDDHMNMYMDLLFIYQDLEMNPDLVEAVIMHEIFHVVFNHIQRGNNWLAAEGKPLNEQTSCDTNLAADIEVNTTLYLSGILDDENIAHIHALFLPEIGHDIVPMENTLENEERMNKLRNMVNYPWPPKEGEEQNGEPEKVKTTEEWDEGFKEAYDKLAEIINKYGAEAARDMLRSAGIVSGVQATVNPKFDEAKLFGMKFINIKSWNDFFAEAVNEAMSGEDNKDYTTKRGGMIEAISQVMDKINQALSNGGSTGGGQQPQGKQKPELETGVNKKDLPPINIPKPKDNQESQQQNGTDLVNVNEIDNGEDQNKDGDKNKDGKQGEQKEGDNGDGSNKEGNNGEGDGQDGEGKDGECDGQQGNGGESSNGGESKPNTPGRGEGSGSKSGGDPNKIMDHATSERRGYKHSGKSYDARISKSSVGNTGTFMGQGDTNIFDRALEQSGYSKEEIEKIKGVIEKNKTINSQENISKKKDDLYKKLSNNSPVKRMLEKIAVEEEKYKNLWKQIMEEFMKDSTRNAGRTVRDEKYRWGEKRKMAIGQIRPRFNFHGQTPQDINVLVDVSGSMDIELYEIIAQSLVVFCEEYEYSGINVIPWASTSTGIHRVDSLDDNGDIETVTKEICGYISEGSSQCGGGTDAIRACCPEIVASACNLYGEDDEEKDHVYVIITDGLVGRDMEGVEAAIMAGVRAETGDAGVGKTAAEHCFWMVYDAPKELQSAWESSIKLGTCVFLNTKVMKGEVKSKK